MEAVFLISNEPVNFHHFASVFLDHLAINNALYLDGNISRLYSPKLNRLDFGFDIGPIVAVEAIGTIAAIRTIAAVGTIGAIGTVGTTGTSRTIGSIGVIGIIGALGTIGTIAASGTLVSIAAIADLHPEKQSRTPMPKPQILNPNPLESTPQIYNFSICNKSS